MERDPLTGSRIRERRVMAGVKQSDLARDVGISPSYLNLIEHNRRRIGGKLLLRLAGALDVAPQILTEGAEAALVAGLREAALDAGLPAAELRRAEEFAGRFPGWAEVLVGRQRRIAALEQSVEALTDRLAHDPDLAASMHELLSTAAAIRSTASILVETEPLQPEWRDRFHANLDEDSRRLAESAQGLVSYLEADPDTAAAAISPQEEVEAFLAEHDYRFDALEAAEGEAEAIVERMVAEPAAALSAPARHIARGVLRQMARDAAQLPLGMLVAAVERHGPDPLALAGALRFPVGRVLRRLAVLPDLKAGLVVCDRSGTVVFRKSVEGFNVPRFGACCPLWPLFGVLGQPGLVLAERLVQAGRAQARFNCYAVAEPQGAQGYNRVPLLQAVMLILPSEGGGEAQEVGVTCRVCPRSECQARREPSFLQHDGNGAAQVQG